MFGFKKLEKPVVFGGLPLDPGSSKKKLVVIIIKHCAFYLFK